MMPSNSLQIFLDGRVQRVLLLITSAVNFGAVLAKWYIFNLIFYSRAEDVVFKAQGVTDEIY